MNTEPEVLLSIENHVATIILNRPKKGNALTANMNQLLTKYLEELANDSNVRVVVLTGAGKFFCTGMDLSAAASKSDDVQESFNKGVHVYELLYRFPKPLVARVNGPCLGGGVGLVFTTDIRVAHKDVYFALTEVKRGIIPAIISQFIVPELGAQKTREYMLTGRRVTAEESTSFLSSIADSSEQLDQQVKSYCDMLLDSAPQAMANVKRLVDIVGAGGDHQRSQNVREEVKKAYLNMMQSTEAAYGISAFVNKKKPDWSAFAKNNAKL